MKKKLVLLLVASIVASMLTITTLLLFFFDREFQTHIKEHEIASQSQILRRLNYLEKVMDKIEVKMEKQFNKAFDLLNSQFSPKKLASLNSEELEKIAIQIGVDQIFLINSEGIVFNTSYKPEMNFNLFDGNPAFKEFFLSLLKTGKIYHQNYVYSQKTGEKFKFAQYAPLTESFVIELGINVKKYIEKIYSPEYYNMLFKESFLSLTRDSLTIKGVDVYGADFYFSILNQGKKLPPDIIQQLQAKKSIKVKKGSCLFLYSFIFSESKGKKAFILEMRTNIAEHMQTQKNVLLITVMMLFLVGLPFLWIALKFLKVKVLSRIQAINQKIEKVAAGDYEKTPPIKGTDELSNIGLNIDKMQKKIQDREGELKEIAHRLEQANQIKSQFIANVNHELRTPMTGISGMVQLLKSSSLSKEQEEYVSIMEVSSHNLLKVIKDVLDFSELQKLGKIESKENQFNLKKTIESIFEQFKEKGKNKGLTAQLTLSATLPENCYGYDYWVRQILIHLLDNAVKFTEKGGFSCVVKESSHPLEEPNQCFIRIEVCDTGIGIAPENLPHIYENFHQVDFSDTRKYGGLGIGLAITQSLISLLKGKIWAESRLEGGSCFFLEFPLQTLLKGEKKEKVTPSHAKTPFSIHVLAIENDVQNILTLEKIILAQGWSIDGAQSGKEGLEKLKNNHYDLVLMDIQMPEMDGFEVTRQIRKKEEQAGKNKKIPIIALSAFYMPGYEKLCLLEGMDGYLEKPLNIEQLLDLIYKVLVKS